MRKKIIFISISLFLITACTKTANDEPVENCVTAFGNAYFNYDLATAQKYCTPESRKWMEYMASSVDANDIEALRACHDKPVFCITDVSVGNDSIATATVKVDNYMYMDVIGKPVQAMEGTTFTFNLIKRNGIWLVDIRGVQAR